METKIEALATQCKNKNEGKLYSMRLDENDILQEMPSKSCENNTSENEFNVKTVAAGNTNGSYTGNSP